MTDSSNGRSGLAVVVGADTAIGFAMAQSMRDGGFDVIGLGEAEESPCAGLADYRKTDYSSYGIPQDCNLLLFCHDAALHASRHAAAMESLCRELAENRKDGKQIHVCVFTPANAYDANGRPVRETSPLCPHSLRELAHVQAEMILRTWFSLTHSTILPNVFRHGELYADMPDAMALAGHVNACLRLARTHGAMTFPGLGLQKRTLTHLDDFASAVAALLRKDCIPSVINIPGETMTIADYMNEICSRFGLEAVIGESAFDDDLPWGVGDRVLSATAFKAELPEFRMRHSFRKWLAGQHDVFCS